MNREVYHNSEAREALVELILTNNRFVNARPEVEEIIDRLVATAVEGASKASDGTWYAETIGARVTAYHAETNGARVTAYHEGEGEHNHFYVEYHYATSTGTAFNYYEYKPVEHAVEVEENDPELIVGMIADEGF